MQLFHLLESKELHANLRVDSLPYARQDKEVNNNSTFAKLTFMRFLSNIPNLNRTITVDCHSHKYNHIGRLTSNSAFTYITPLICDLKPSLICFPDIGAKGRYGKGPLSEGAIINDTLIRSCSFTKVRNQDTGRIERLDLNELVDVEGQTVLIIDDICDGGMTFKLTAEKLLTLGAKEVNLYTTHGIYSKGVDTLRESGISRIFNRKGEL